MKKIPLLLVPVAMLAANAYAQSSVTIFGIVDAAVTRVSAGGSGHVTGLTAGSSGASRLGFRGTEDLGGGLAASFWLEASLGNDDGNASGFTFQRRSTVSISGPFGEVRLGRDYAPSYWNATFFDPFGTRGVGQFLDLNGASLGSTNVVRNSNSVGYFLPASLGGIYGQVQYAFGEQVSTVRNDKSGNHLSGRIGYADGPVNVAVSYGVTQQLYGANNTATATAPATTGGDLKTASIAGSYNFGVVKPFAFYGSSKVQGASVLPDSQLNTLMVGATAPLGSGELRATIARYDLKNSANDADKFALGFSYNLSKRTQIYTTVARLKNKGTAQYSVAGKAGDQQGIVAPLPAPGRASTGFDIGIRHAF